MTGRNSRVLCALCSAQRSQPGRARGTRGKPLFSPARKRAPPRRAARSISFSLSFFFSFSLSLSLFASASTSVFARLRAFSCLFTFPFFLLLFLLFSVFLSSFFPVFFPTFLSGFSLPRRCRVLFLSLARKCVRVSFRSERVELVHPFCREFLPVFFTFFFCCTRERCTLHRSERERERERENFLRAQL